MNKYRMRGSQFVQNANLGPRQEGKPLTARGSFQARADMSMGMPPNTNVRAFAKPTQVSLGAGLIPEDPYSLIRIAREMLDNDSVAGAVAESIAGALFGNFALASVPDKEHLKPYTTSLDRIRVKTLLPSMALGYLVDGTWLATGVFDSKSKAYSAIMPQDMLHANIYPVPFFGATPVVDVSIPPEVQRLYVGMKGDQRFQQYYEFLPDDFKRSGLVQLQPENTFYVPRRGLSHNALGVSLFRKIMIPYLLEKALARGTIEMSYRRQRPILHVIAGDENWDPSVEEMNELSQLFLSADLDPLGAVVTTRAGVQPQEIGGAGDFWRWTDNIDVLTSLKLKGLGMPDGLLGGDMSLDSVSATLTVFINMLRTLRDYLTRTFFYEKLFPYIAITNDHRRDLIGAGPEYGAFRKTSKFSGNSFSYGSYVERANDSDVDLGDYITPTISWHNSMRPEGDKEYLDLLHTLTDMGVPIQLRTIAAAGGQDIDDLLNGAPDDVEIRQRVAQVNDAIAQTAPQQGDDGGGEYGRFDPHTVMTGLRPKGIVNREYDDRLHPRTNINGHSYHTTAREKKRRDDVANKIVAQAQARLAPTLNAHAEQRVPRKRTRAYRFDHLV